MFKFAMFSDDRGTGEVLAMTTLGAQFRNTQGMTLTQALVRSDRAGSERLKLA